MENENLLDRIAFVLFFSFCMSKTVLASLQHYKIQINDRVSNKGKVHGKKAIKAKRRETKDVGIVYALLTMWFKCKSVNNLQTFARSNYMSNDPSQKSFFLFITCTHIIYARRKRIQKTDFTRMSDSVASLQRIKRKL